MIYQQSLGLVGTQVDKNTVQFPLELEIVFNKLKVIIHQREFNFPKETGSFWIYVTYGLAEFGQDELVLAIKKAKNNLPGDFPQAPLEFFKTVYEQAKAGCILKAGSVSEFETSGFLAKEFRGIGYVPAQSLEDWVSPENSLACLLLTEDELTCVGNAGLTRVLALFGKEYKYFPYPWWNDLRRKSVIDQKILCQMKEGIIEQFPRILIRGAYATKTNNVIDICLPLCAKKYFAELDALDKQSPFVLLVDLPPEMDSLLVWQGNVTSPRAMHGIAPTGGTTSGSFVCFLPAQEEQTIIVEDGFVVTLKTSSWNVLKQCLKNGTEFYSSKETNGYDCRLSWQDTPEQASRLSCDTGVKSECTPQDQNKETNSEPEKSTVPAFIKKIELISHESEVKNLISEMTLQNHIDHLVDVVRDHFQCISDSDNSGFDLQLECLILPEGKSKFQIFSNPMMDKNDEQDLLDRLALSYAPPISSGQISFRLNLAIWGGK